MEIEGPSVTDARVAVSHQVASKVPFGQLCKLFERIKKAKSNPVRQQELENFIRKWRTHHDNLHSELIASGKTPKDSFFPVLRLLLPQLDRARPSYGAKETMLAKLYINVLGLSKTNADALKILEYRNPKTNRTATGDFAEIAYIHVLSKRCTSEGSLSIEEINNHLDMIARYNNDRKKDMVQKIFMNLIKNTSAEQQKWLIRILLKDLKLGLGQAVILKTFHKDAEELFNVTTNLEEVCIKLHNPSVELADAEISLFMPFRPMLAFNAKLNEVEALMSQREFRLEIKYDGERSQLHKSGGQYKYFSRSGKEYTSSFGGSVYSGTLTPYIHDLFASNVNSCILDGEMMGYNQEMKTFMQKGGQFDVKHILEDSDLQPCFVAYDVLNVNGKSLSAEPLFNRLKVLKSIFTASEGRMQFAESKNASSNQEVSAYLNEAIDRREEGIIVKHPNSTYAPNKRKGSGWFKIKPDYVGGVVDDLDLIIVGGKFGSGRHGNLINKFMLAVREGEGSDAKFRSFSMVGSGYSNEELLEITETLKPNLNVFQKQSPPDWLIVSKDKPEVIVHPQKSIVVQVRAAEIIHSSAYATGCTLRFPRIISTRGDKTMNDAMDIDELKRLREMADGKLTARHSTLTREPTPKKRKVTQERRGLISTKFLGPDLTNVEQSSSSFDGYELCILHITSKDLKSDLEKKIASYGGSVVRNPTPDTYCVIAENEKNIRIRSVIKAAKSDVVKISWLQNCLEAGKILPFSPDDMIFVTQETKVELKKRFDKFGDGYEININPEGLRKLFAAIPIENQIKADKTAISSMQSTITAISSRYTQYGFHEMPTSLFQGLQFYLHDKLVIGDSTTAVSTLKWRELKSAIVFFSGIVSDELSTNVTHCIYDLNEDLSTTMDEILKRRAAMQKKFHIVSTDWIWSCINDHNLVPERPFEYKRSS